MELGFFDEISASVDGAVWLEACKEKVRGRIGFEEGEDIVVGSKEGVLESVNLERQRALDVLFSNQGVAYLGRFPDGHKVDVSSSCPGDRLLFRELHLEVNSTRGLSIWIS